MQALKIAVVVMGILIVAGFAVVGVEIYRRIAHPGVHRAAGTPESVTDITLGLPEGSHLGDPIAVGTQLAIRATLPQGGERLFLIDPGTHRVTAILPDRLADGHHGTISTGPLTPVPAQ